MSCYCLFAPEQSCEQLHTSEEAFECCIICFFFSCRMNICVGDWGLPQVRHHVGASDTENMLLFVSELLKPEGLSFRAALFL